MKILHLSEYSWENGGPSQMIFDHAKYQLSLGHDVTILTPYDEKTAVYKIPEGATLIKGHKNFISRFFHHFSTDTWQYLKANRDAFDLIHIHGIWNFSGIAPFMLNMKGIKLITPHGMLGGYSLNKSKKIKQVFSMLFQKRFLQKANLIHVFKAEMAELDDYLGYRHPGAFILPNGIQEADYTPLPDGQIFRSKYGIGNDEKVILFLGRIDAKKGIDLLLPAFKSVAENHQNARLVLVGPDYGMQPFVEKFTKENQLTDRVLLTGILKGREKLEAFAAADMFTLPSYSEGFSIAVMEALTCGVPVVVSAFTGFSEVIADYKAGKIAELTPESIAENLEFYLENETERQAAAQQARKLIRENYAIQKVATDLLDTIAAYADNHAV